MKNKFLFLFIIGCVMCLNNAFAQTMLEVVYLTNGSIIKGTIIEQIPGKLLKIQTYDGSIFAYKMTEVEKITKEIVPRSNKMQHSTQRSTRTPYTPHYRGFIETGYTVGVNWNVDRIELMTSHGIQIIPQLFAGLGTGLHYYYSISEFSSPVFVNIRTDILKRNITPYIDAKIGYSIPYSNLRGFYFSPTIGCCFSSNKNTRFNAGVSYVVQKCYGLNFDGLSIKVGIDF